MFTKVLVANRGEIACRIIRTLQSMGMTTVAVYSEVDVDALHVQMADEAVCIGPAAPGQSYLNISSVVSAAKNTGCQAIHPGYGFLSENAAFAESVEAEGLTLIAPSAAAMDVMGDKIKAKGLAREAGVPVIPGSPLAIGSGREAQTIADQIGYPVMLKAAAGGGGKGMRIVHEASQLEEAFQRATNEAETSFGDSRLFVEKFIENPRHIEIQILADQKGHVVYLGERECSLQRRHQKVVEEAPSPFVDVELRQAMGEQAIALARAVNYSSAGTVEFVVGEDRTFYFLEMNTRLQVEHPVTEFITGLDLVEEMVRIAAGEPLRINQDEVTLKGHAIEARVYAEDSARGFLPSSGRLIRFRPPALGEGVRLDTGVQEGDEITTFYDPMIAKLIAYGPTRETACLSLQSHLDAFYIRGIATNISFLSYLLGTPDFQEGKITAPFLDEAFPEGFTPPMADTPQIPVATAAVMDCIRDKKACGEEKVVVMGREAHPVHINPERACYEVMGKGWNTVVETQWNPSQPVFTGLFNGHRVALQVDLLGTGWQLGWGGHQAFVQVMPPRVAELFLKMPEKDPPDHSNLILSPMPGLVLDVRVKMGDRLKAGQPVAVIEAMKMENVICAPKDGVVASLSVTSGDSVTVDQEIVRLV